MNPDDIGFLIKGIHRLLTNPITGLTLLYTLNQTNQIMSCHAFTWRWGWGSGTPQNLLCLLDPPSFCFAPINNHACMVLWCLRRKELRLEHPISKPTKPTQPVTVDYPEPPLPAATSTPPLSHHMLVCSATLFTFLLANYLPLSPVCLGAGRSLIGGISAIL